MCHLVLTRDLCAAGTLYNARSRCERGDLGRPKVSGQDMQWPTRGARYLIRHEILTPALTYRGYNVRAVSGVYVDMQV